LEEHAKVIKETTHLRTLLQDQERSQALVAEHEGIVLDYSRENVTLETVVSFLYINFRFVALKIQMKTY